MDEAIRADRVQDAIDLLHNLKDVQPAAIDVIVKAVGLTPAEYEKMIEVLDVNTRWHNWRAAVANARADALNALSDRPTPSPVPNRQQRRAAARIAGAQAND